MMVKHEFRVDRGAVQAAAFTSELRRAVITGQQTQYGNILGFRESRTGLVQTNLLLTL
jgi:hypothetical protein